ncbi:DTW domain-containing protein [Pseudoduganella ginsengisoli]|uniref:tRNA-uridine aminocarboxypropyltransferase n=1 Tax=Pseudoduganella ginsengisoli TaxID=1462440 RepID=A0A6L6PWZ2_9BURK|nr:tRNA-uridine aminocarboxypropyltransferase [Pseudoduganella ginsengisoli]MTW02113.1 DTW domain-containing protein [Pseudoduganella ginsengisoli]
MNSTTSTPRRAMCGVCLRSQATCICHWAAPVASRAGVLILQHPMEAHNAKNSARLLHLCLPGSVMAVGEVFDDSALSGLLAGPRRPVLLYPDTPGDTDVPPFDPAWMQAPEQLLLVALDATWRKSRKMLYQNPVLQRLPRLPLRDMPASHYRIRKAHAPDQLSTLEAVAYALAQIENENSKYAPLIAAFDNFVSQQASYIP